MSKGNKRKEERKQYIFALKQLTDREIKRKYARSYLGIVWSVLNPLMTMAVLSMIFSAIFKRSIENFPIYYLTGSIFWTLFSTATNSAMSALVDNKNLLLKVKLSKQTFVLSRMLTALVNFGYTCIAYLLMILVFRVEFTWYMLLFPVAVIGIMMFSMGIGFMLSIFYVFFGDVKYLYSVLLTLWMYMSALFYPVENLAPSVAIIVKNNPVYMYVKFARDCVLYGTIPDMENAVKMLIWSVVTFLVGWFVFKKNENKVMQHI